MALLYVQWNARLAIGDWLARERWQRCSFPDRPGFTRLPGIEPSWLRFRTRPSRLRPRVLAARRSSPRPRVAVGTACSNQQPLHGSTRPQLPESQRAHFRRHAASQPEIPVLPTVIRSRHRVAIKELILQQASAASARCVRMPPEDKRCPRSFGRRGVKKVPMDLASLARGGPGSALLTEASRAAGVRLAFADF